jgi:hypothetical protein
VQQSCAHAKEVCSKYDLLLLPVFDWPNITIRPRDLLLVVPTYLQSQFQFFGWVCKKVNN